MSIEEAVDFVYHHLNHVINSCVPTYSMFNSSYPAWFSKELVSVIKTKRKAHFLYKHSYSYSDYLIFTNLRSKCKALHLKCWNSYVVKTENVVNDNANIFWSSVNSLKGTKPPSHIFYNDRFYNDDSVIANCFADFFEFVYMTSNYAPKEIECEHDLNITNIDISIGEVFDHLNLLNLKSGPGIDGIPPVFFKSCKYIMSRILWILFNKSLVTDNFPIFWKRCTVTPIFKGGDRALVSNYRPISKQNIMPKILENVIADKLSLLFKNVLTNEQYGFMMGRSNSINLFLYHDYLNSAIENGSQVDAIYTDFRKAFDSVDHAILLSKLSSFGIGGPLFK